MMDQHITKVRAPQVGWLYWVLTVCLPVIFVVFAPREISMRSGSLWPTYVNLGFASDWVRLEMTGISIDWMSRIDMEALTANVLFGLAVFGVPFLFVCWMSRDSADFPVMGVVVHMMFAIGLLMILWRPINSFSWMILSVAVPSLDSDWMRMMCMGWIIIESVCYCVVLALVVRIIWQCVREVSLKWAWAIAGGFSVVTIIEVCQFWILKPFHQAVSVYSSW